MEMIRMHAQVDLRANGNDPYARSGGPEGQWKLAGGVSHRDA